MKLHLTIIAISTILILSCKMEEKAINTSDLDIAVSPGTDFYDFSTGGWKKNNPLPNDESRFGSFDLLRKETNAKVKVLIEELGATTSEYGSNAQKVGSFYSSGMDTESIEKLGITPIQPFFDKVNAINYVDDVQSTIAFMHKSGFGSLFACYGSPDPDNSSMNILQFAQSGLGLSDRDYYTQTDPRSKEIQVEYVAHMTRMFKLLKYSDENSVKAAESIMAFETALAESSMTLRERRDPNSTKNKMNSEQLSATCPNFDWQKYFTFVDVDLKHLDNVNVGQPEFYKAMSTLLSSENVDTWKNYLTWNIIRQTASNLNNDFVVESFNFNAKFLSGRPEMQARWERIVKKSEGLIGDVVGMEFVAKYFPPEAKVRMVTLVENLKAAFALRVDNLDWMSAETKVKAKEKLATMSVKIGYPDKWEDYSKLEIKDQPFVLNVLESNRFGRNKNYAEIGKPVNKEQWFMPPQMVNAYYSPQMNEICFPAGILQPPFFYQGADDAVNYGAIGVVIGHEMTHGFDDKGCMYDKDGNLSNWWTEEDSKKFEAKTKVLVDQFNEFIVLDTLHADGELTLGENIADLGGLSISYDAWMLDNGAKPSISGYTAAQRFYLSYGKIWGQNIRDKQVVKLTKEDVHSLGRFRVNGPLPSLETFLTAFDIKEGDPMFLRSEDRAKIW